MTPETFVRKHKDDWQNLETLLKKNTGTRLDFMTEADVLALDNLYRSAVADLALAQRDFPQHDATAYLNALVGRAHHVVYRGGNVGRRQIRRFFTHDIPQTVQRNWKYVLAAHLIFYLPAIIAYFLVLPNPDLAYTIFPEGADMYQWVESTGKLWIDIESGESSIAGASIMTNNIQVAFMAFAGGMVAGLITLYVLLFNGLMLGVVFAFVQNYGLAGDLGNFVVGHGPVELSVICLAGAAGLRVGHSMIAPGLMRRRDAVVAAAKDAMTMAFIGALLLVGAGTIEGFISPSPDIPFWVKATIGVVTGLLMWSYLLLGGREKKQLDLSVSTVGTSALANTPLR